MILAPDDPNLVEAILDARFVRRYLAEGDSWFSVGGWTGNLLMALDAEDTLIVNCAYPGDTLADMGRSLFARALAACDGVPRWDAVLLSGGGNDLLRNCGRYVVPNPSAPINNDALLDRFAEIERHLVRLLVLCRAGQPGVPVFMHTYDYPPASRRWWFWNAGPWLAPVLAQAGVDRARWDSLAAMLIDELAARLHATAADWPGLAIVETRGRLLPQGWRNEIHPTAAGYAELASAWRKKLQPPAAIRGAFSHQN